MGLALIAVLLSAAGPARDETGSIAQAPRPDVRPAAWPAARLILFGARWCAPCLAELRDLGSLASAAHPQVLVLAWVDHPIHRLAAAKGVDVMPPDMAQALAERAAGRSYGLPLAVMTDAAGKPCAVRHARVLPSDIAAMRVQCAYRPLAPAITEPELRPGSPPFAPSRS